MSNWTLDEFLITDFGRKVALSWLENEIRAVGKFKKRGFNAELASSTGFSLSYVGKVLSGKTKATSAFLFAFAKYINLPESEVLPGLINKSDELEYLLPVGRERQRIIARELADPPVPDGKAQETVDVFLKGMGEWWLHHPERNPMTSIENLYSAMGDEELGFCVTFIMHSLWKLPRHEVIDLAYQLRKLTDGDSDKLATAAADERFERSGIKPTTRLKLERIPVEPEEEKQEK